MRYRRVGEVGKVVLETRLRWTPQIENDLNNFFEVSETDERLPDREGEDVEELREFPTRGNGWDPNGQYRPCLPLEPRRGSSRCRLRYPVVG